MLAHLLRLRGHRRAGGVPDRPRPDGRPERRRAVDRGRDLLLHAQLRGDCRLSSDILLSYASTQAEADAFAAQPYAQAIPAVAAGHHAVLVGDELIAAVSPPTVLSMTWGLDDYLSALSAAV